MKTYKIGNKVNAIIRAYSAGKFANTEMTYDNQPYTIISGVSAELTFKNNDKLSKIADKQVLTFNHDQLSQVTIKDVELNEKILNLIYQQNVDAPLCTKAENYTSSGTIIYLNTNKTIYQVFIYNDEGQLEAAYGSYDDNELEVEKEDSSYLIVYSYKGDKSFFLNKPENYYCTIDLEIEGNIDDETSNMYIHIDKCGVKVDNNMYFNQSANAIDLSLIVLDTGLDYITVE